MPRVAAAAGALELEPGSVLYDLGSGDGRIVFAAARREPRARVVGVEKALVPYLIARGRRAVLTRQWRRSSPGPSAPVPSITLRKQNIFKTDLRDATHVYCFLMPAMMQDIEKKFERELSPGARVVASDFKLPAKEPTHTIKLGGRALGKTLFVYDF